ncbi:hypothetical protein OIU79_012172 [Salix purpurea]|uniref:Uncharacterized protein n=1 Tax=Salix purpurea TaxID=77065 RepID=A0A9Q0Q2I2_SALPP|nr:hypothetical protein OIU79_012172 [Salix purpurea]
MAAKNGCSEAARLLLAHGAFIKAKANVCFLEWNDTITPGSLVLNQWKIAQLLRHCWSIMLTAVQRTMYCRCSIFSILIHFSLL